jgi:hypothetical protein
VSLDFKAHFGLHAVDLEIIDRFRRDRQIPDRFDEKVFKQYKEGMAKARSLPYLWYIETLGLTQDRAAALFGMDRTTLSKSFKDEGLSHANEAMVWAYARSRGEVIVEPELGDVITKGVFEAVRFVQSRLEEKFGGVQPALRLDLNRLEFLRLVFSSEEWLQHRLMGPAGAPEEGARIAGNLLNQAGIRDVVDPRTELGRIVLSWGEAYLLTVATLYHAGS